MHREVAATMQSERVHVVNDETCCTSLVGAPLSEDEAIDLATVLAALADPARLRILSLLIANEQVCSCDLVEPLGRSQPTVSHHTRVLAEAGLIFGEKRGKWTWWRLNADRLGAVSAALGGNQH
jgi:ArsR family transcriptional regulator, arsenate/arsenite/antimonite-responsive transcriptional repressor